MGFTIPPASIDGRRGFSQTASIGVERDCEKFPVRSQINEIL